MTEFKREIIKKLMVQEELTRGSAAHWGISKAIEIVEQTPDESTDPKWTPCANGTPDKPGKYLVLYDYGDEMYDFKVLDYFTEETEIFSTGWHDLHDFLDSVMDYEADMIAWRPLPEPYKRDSNG